MPQVHDIGPLFAHQMTYPTRKFPLVDVGHTQEIEWPYRSGRALVFRIPLSTQAFVVGLWGESRDEERALAEAIGAREVGPHVP